MASFVDTFRMVGPLIAAAVVIRCLVDTETVDITHPLAVDQTALGRLYWMWDWLTRDSSAMDLVTAVQS